MCKIDTNACFKAKTVNESLYSFYKKKTTPKQTKIQTSNIMDEV